MDLDIINNRIDASLMANRRAEHIVTGMAVAIFLLGLSTVIVGYWSLKNVYIGSSSLLFQGLLYWPIKEILKLRRDNLILQTVPVLVTSMSPAEAALEIAETIAYLRK